MAYQDDFRNKVLAALKAKNLAVDISQEATQQAIVKEAQSLAKSEAKTMSAADMKQVLEDVAKELSNEKQQFSAQSSDFIAFKDQLAGDGPTGPGGSYSGGGIAVSVANKDIMIIPANGGLGAAGSATSVNSLSQIDFKHIANPLAYGVNDPNEVKSSLFNWAERITGTPFDTPVLGLGGAWGGVSYAPTAQWGIGGSQGSGVGGSINTDKGFGQIIYFKPATSTIYASLFNDIGLDTSYTNRTITITNYRPASPGAFPTAGFAVTFGGIGNSGDLVFHGAIDEAQTNTIKFLSPLTISNSTAANTLTLGLSSATSTVQNFVGGGTAQYNLSTTTSSFAQGDLFYASGTGHVTLTKLAIGGNNTYLTSNGSIPSWTSSISANTVAVNAATGSTILYPLLNNIAGAGAAISTDIDFSVDPGANILRYATGSFYVGTAVSSPLLTSSGDVSIRPGANSTTGIQLDNLAGQPILNVDTNNSRVSIGSNVAVPNYTLDVAGDTNISTGSVFRINGTSVLSNNTLGSTVTVSSLTQVGTIATGSWAATAITAHYGGTGLQTPFAVGDILYANTATTWARLADVATGSVLASGGVGVAPAYVLTNTLSVGTAVTANNLNVANATTNSPHFIRFGPSATGTGIATSTNLTISFNPATFILSTSGLAVTATTATTTTTSGALIVSGGMGLAGNAFIGGTVYVPSSTASNFSNLLVSNNTSTTSTTSGALVVSGGMGLAGNAFIGGTAYVPSTTPSNFSNLLVSNNTATTSTTSGALVVNGGLGLAGNAFIGGTAYVPSTTPSNFSNLLVSNTTATTTTTSGALVVSGGLGLAGNAFIGSTVYVPSSTPSNFSNLLVSNNTATTSNTSGALVVSGGLGLAGNAFIGGTINVPSTSTSNISNVTFANGIVTAGVWQGTAVGTTYGGSGSNLSPSGGVGNSNRIQVNGGSGQYATTLIDNATSGNLLVSGGPLAAPTFTNTTNGAFSFASGTLTINNAAITTGTITGVPTNANDIVNKTYADSISAGLDIHDSARLTTISAIGGSYRQSGAAGTLSGQGDYIIATTPGALIGLDAGWDTSASGIALTNGQRVLIKDGVLGGYASGTGAFGAYPTTYGGFSSSWVANGIYEVASYGGAATSGWLLVRATDSDNQAGFQELTGGTFTFVEEGTLYADNAFVCSNDTSSRGPIGFGATQISWTPFSGGASLIMGQGLTKVGNTIATNFKLLQASSVNANLSNGFSIGGERSGSVGSSSYATWVVTGSAALSTNTLTANTTGFSLAGGQTNTTLTVAGVAAANTLTGAADGFTLAGGTTGRTLTVIGGNITVANGVFNGAGFGLTLGSSSTLSLNSQTLTLSASSGNLTFTGTANNATTQNIVTSGTAQYQLSTADTTFTAGDLYYGGGALFAALSRLAFGSGTGNSVLIRGANAPAWGTIALANSNFVSGVLAISNGGTNNGSLSVTNGQVVYTDGSKLAATAVGTADQFLKSAGSGAPTWSAITLSNTTSVTGTLGISNGGTNATATPTNGGVSYGTGTAYAFTGAGTANSVLLSTGAGAPIWGAVVLSSANSVTGTLPVTNGGLGAASFTANGILYGNGSSAIQVTGAAANAILVTNGSNVPSLSTDIPTAVTIGGAYNYRAGGTDISLADGGTNNSLTAVTGAVAYSDASKIVLTNAGTGGSVLISNGTNPLFSAINLASSNAVTGVLPIANGGSNATSANFTTNGVVIYDGTRLASATGLTMTGGVGLSVNGTTSSTGGFFIAGNSVISSLTVTSAIYGAVTLNSAASVGGTSFLSQSGNTVTLNYPGTGLTGGGAVTQVPYYNAARELTGDVGLVYSRTAATGIGLSLNINATTGTILRVNSAQAFTSGLLLDVDNNGTQAFSVDFKGMSSIAAASGNTALIATGGRTVLAPANANYASLNLGSNNANPGSGTSFQGDLWYNGTNLYFQTGATSKFDLLVGSVSGSGTINRVVKWSTTTALTDSNISDAGVGMTITATSAVGVGLGSTAYLTIQSLTGDEAALIKNNAYFVRGVNAAGARLFSVDVAGNLRATTKSFDIPHPTKEGARLVYGVLEGPEHGVYHRGTVEGNGVIQINLPEYWHKLVGDQYTIQLTPWGNYNVCINSKTENYFTIQLVGDFISRKFKNIKVDYIVHGSRLDAPLETEQ
jgi:hypothetical protein